MELLPKLPPHGQGCWLPEAQQDDVLISADVLAYRCRDYAGALEIMPSPRHGWAMPAGQPESCRPVLAEEIADAAQAQCYRPAP